MSILLAEHEPDSTDLSFYIKELKELRKIIARHEIEIQELKESAGNKRRLTSSKEIANESAIRTIIDSFLQDWKTIYRCSSNFHNKCKYTDTSCRRIHFNAIDRELASNVRLLLETSSNSYFTDLVAKCKGKPSDVLAQRLYSQLSASILTYQNLKNKRIKVTSQ